MAQNYVVIEGERYDFVKPKGEHDCINCAFNNWCDGFEVIPCTVFSQVPNWNDMEFVKHEVKSNRGISIVELSSIKELPKNIIEILTPRLLPNFSIRDYSSVRSDGIIYTTTDNPNINYIKESSKKISMSSVSLLHVLDAVILKGKVIKNRYGYQQ